MTIQNQANDDFQRAVRRALWRRVSSWLRREDNELIPYHEIKHRLPIQGQSYLGIRTVPLAQIIGSTGRFRDFDRAFLPTQARTKSRWMNIDRAHLEKIDLPPIQLYKIGEAFFVRDGNHRVSVAREQGLLEIDAEVIEIRVPVPITAETRVKDLDLMEEYWKFLEKTGLQESFPDVSIEFSSLGEYNRLCEHVNAHRWYLGEKAGMSVTYQDAAKSWYENVYLPLISMIREEGIAEDFPDRTEADLFLWISEYQWYRREAFREEYSAEQAGGFFIDDHGYWPAKKLVRALGEANWLDKMILSTEKESFEERTRIQELRPDARIDPSAPGQYENLLEHIDVHRWYLGQERAAEVDYFEAVGSWFDRVYTPLVEVIREQKILNNFPGRSETDLYLWIMVNRSYLLEETET